VLGEFNRQSMVFNVLIPPLLMFLLVLSIRLPKKENLDRVILETMKIVYEKEKKDVYLVKPSRRKGIILNLIVFIFYSLTFVVSFGLIIWGLKKLDFGTLSIIIFLMFFSLIAFAGVKIRERARELDITEKRAGFIAFLTDTFSLPFLRVGKWLSNQWTRFNIVVVLITALIDMPFQLFTEFLEHWRTFLKEKKEEIH
jgi:nitrate reductase NapE component